MAVVIVAFIPFYWARESARQNAAVVRIRQESVQKGSAIFQGACAACHGQQAQGGIGPALGGADAGLVRGVVRSGKGIMPRFSAGQISEAQLEDMVAFLGSIVSSKPSPAAPVPAPVSTAKPTVTPAAKPTVTPTAKPTATPTAPAAPKAGDLVSKGEELYLRKAAGAGCAVCHGADARGGMGPNVRGISAQKIRDALKTGTIMKSIKVTDDEIEAVSAYLKSLESPK